MCSRVFITKAKSKASDERSKSFSKSIIFTFVLSCAYKSQNLIVVKGSIPGKAGNLVSIKSS